MVKRKSGVKEEFLQSLRHHLDGLRRKVELDFSQVNFEHELAELIRDPVYSKFSFDSPEYVLIRLVGRISISIGRRLGEIYDKIPRFVAAARFNLTSQQVAPMLENLELDIALRYSLLSRSDVKYVKTVLEQYIGVNTLSNGIGIEIRYNFNPNDSARLRKDVAMAKYVVAENLLPVYLVFSAISPRQEAISRLQRAGWKFIVGETAIEFAQALLGMDLGSILDEPTVKAEVKKEVDAILKSMIMSHAFQKVIERHMGTITEPSKRKR